MVVDFDDWSYEHDCRMELEKLKEINPKFKVTLFTIPAKTTIDMLDWAAANDYWVEIVQHGWDHHSNWECEKWTYEEALANLAKAAPYFPTKGFKAPGWQISTETMQALRDSGYWIADQPYNDDRRPEGLKVYKVGEFDYHGHTWDCGCNNGINEDWDNIAYRVKIADSFQFVSERVV
jgi:hypothetical protein